MTQNRCLSTEEIRKSSFHSKAKQNKYVKLCTEVQSCFFLLQSAAAAAVVVVIAATVVAASTAVV